MVLFESVSMPVSLPQRGFTLIELIVTVSIILVLFGAGLAGFFQFNDRQKVQNTVASVKQLIESARTRARIRDNPSSSCTLQAYRVSTSGSNILMQTLCGVSKFSNLTIDQTRETLALPSGITVTAFSVDYFTLLGSARRDTPAANGRIYVSGSSMYYLFEIRDSGEITEGCFVASTASTTCL